MKRLFWIEQRYVVPIMAEDLEGAIGAGFSLRMDIAREVGPVSEREHRGGSHSLIAQEREGWDDCQPYGADISDKRNVAQIEGRRS